jgi:hypothetical protein
VALTCRQAAKRMIAVNFIINSVLVNSGLSGLRKTPKCITLFLFGLKDQLFQIVFVRLTLTNYRSGPDRSGLASG